MRKIADFTAFEIETVQSTVNERFEKEMGIQFGDTEIRLNQDSTDMTMCPIMLWKKDDCQSMIIKQGQHAYHPHFFYEVTEVHGTGANEYADMANCINSLLQTQANHHSQRKGEFPAE